MPRAFVIRPFGTKTDSKGKEIDFEAVHTSLIAPALQLAGLAGDTTVEVESAGNIRADMFALILEADLVICDVTVHNANVFYELGVRHALRKRGTVLIKGSPSADTTPFDLLTDRYLAYQCADPAASKAQLVRMIEATIRGDRVSDSPVFSMMPGLEEVDPAIVQALPIAFAEEVDRATASQARGWLRLLAEDVQGRRFEQAGLRMVGTAQWRLRDLEAAQESLETIREVYPNDVKACLSLANVYERLAKEQFASGSDGSTSLAKSDQCIARVLANGAAKPADRVEAYALRGRNLKTIWRRGFEKLPLEQRRVRAMNRQLRDSYAAYRSAFQYDQNHFWSGLGALQMAAVFLELSASKDAGWTREFDDDVAATTYRATIERDFAVSRQAVRASIEAATTRLSAGEPDLLWARVSHADLLFVENGEDERTFRRYEGVFPELDPFGWDAVRQQLELFSTLGFRADLATRIIAAGDALSKPRERKCTVIVFAGHQPDLPDRSEPRFPNDRVAAAKAQIREQLMAIQNEANGHAASNPDATMSPLVGLASAAPGGDILFHEVCLELGIPSTLCLPIPAAEYVGQTYDRYSDWKGRMLDVMDRRRGAVLELSDRAELPPWLAEPPRNPPIDFWERGNRWVFAMARAYDSERAYLVTLWDGKPMADGTTGGTAHMVKLAAATKEFRVKTIDPGTLAAAPA